MSAEKKTVRIPVRTLVEFLLRSGDLTGGAGRIANREAMLAGSRIHRKIQSRRGADYRAEVALGERFDCGMFDLVVEGRADGIEAGQEGALIEEIKGIYQDVNELEAPVPVHLAQASCYAAIYGRQQQLEQIRIRMTYCNLETEEIRSFTSSHSVGELRLWFEELCAQYRKWAAFQIEWHKIRNQSAAHLEFPFSYRRGQRDMVVSVYRTLQQGGQLFVQAPTGVGKTMSVLFPAMHVLAEGGKERVIYLTAKTIARTAAEEAFRILAGKGLRCKSVTLTAKEKICVADKPVCDPGLCPRAKGHYDRINDALYALLTEGEDYTRSGIQDWSRRFCVCPYELQLDLADFADAVICDYNYAFDPAARLARFFGEGSAKGSCLLLIDEAHNLVERSRDMFSAALRKEAFLELKKHIRPLAGGGRYRALDRALSACNRVLLAYRKACEADAEAVRSYGSICSEREEIQDLIGPLMTLAGILEAILKEPPGGEDRMIPGGDDELLLREELLAFYFEVSAFLGIFQLLDDHFIIYTEKSRGSFTVKLFCIDPSECLQEVLDRSGGAVFFSATMLPMQYYESLLTSARDSYRMAIPSPFDSGMRHLTAGCDVTTRYSRRGPAAYQRIADYIRAVTTRKKGNYMVYFPSYRMRDDVLEAYLARDAEEEEVYRPDPASGEVQLAGRTLLIQQPGMTEADRDTFLQRFREPDGCTLIGFCVMGGIFSEGIDLTGDQLIGVIVVGTGLPQVSGERELLKRYYDRKNEAGFDYAYRFPGLNKVLQAAGRLIRTTEDEGVIVLLDDRFRTGEYIRHYPPEWRDMIFTDIRKIEAEVEGFWRRRRT